MLALTTKIVGSAWELPCMRRTMTAFMAISALAGLLLVVSVPSPRAKVVFTKLASNQSVPRKVAQTRKEIIDIRSGLTVHPKFYELAKLYQQTRVTSPWAKVVSTKLASNQSVPRKVEQTRKDPNFDDLAKLYQQTRVDCSALFSGKNSSIKTATQKAELIESLEALESNEPQPLSESLPFRQLERLPREWLQNATKDCAWFKRVRGYILSPLSKEEAEFPIAFSLVVYKDVEMVERLFRMIYRPQNYYCIHVDAKADKRFLSAVSSIAACFPQNVLMASKQISVKWGEMSVLEPELICMQDMWKASNSSDKSKKWKYFINLTGQEFPLKTNYELVKILKAYKGANNGDGSRHSKWNHRWNMVKARAPHGIIPAKGGVHVALNRATVDYILHNKIAKDFLLWVKNTSIPDETYFTSLNFNPHLKIPGSYRGKHISKVRQLTRYKMWFKQPCAGKHKVRNICILSTGDLPRLGKAIEMFANKFYITTDRVVLGCLEEKLFNSTREEFLGNKTFDTAPYEKMDFVRHQVPHPR